MPAAAQAPPAEPQAAARRLGQGTVRFLLPPRVVAGFAIVGPMEGKGPLAGYMDCVLEDTFYGERCWERTESKMLKDAVHQVAARANCQESDIDVTISTDLLNQCVSSSFAMRSLRIPHVGIFCACAGFAGGSPWRPRWWTPGLPGESWWEHPATTTRRSASTAFRPNSACSASRRPSGR